MERRNFERTMPGNDGIIIIQDIEMNCIIQNISEGGVLIKIDKKHSLSNDDVGKEIFFVSESTSSKKIKARIIKYQESEDAHFLAMFFLNE